MGERAARRYGSFERRALGTLGLRVFQVMAGAAEGGAETYFVDLVLALERAGLSQRIAIRTNSGRAAALEAGGIEPVQFRFGRLDLSTRRQLASAILEWQPNVVQTWMNRATRHCPGGAFVHVGWLGGYYDPKYFRRCDHVAAVTPDIVAHLRSNGGWAEDRSHYLPTFAANASVPAVPRRDLETPDDVPLFLALGRLHTKKAFDVLLAALGEVPEAHLWLAGEGPLRGALEAQASALGLMGRVRFLGWRTDREALLAAADFCVMPSRYEPFGTVMIEAWAAQRPLIAAAAAGPRGLVTPDVDAILVPVDDVPALAQAMRRLIAEPEFGRSLAENAFARFQTQFTETAVVEQYLDFYATITG